MELERGTDVWVRHTELAWAPGRVIAVAEKDVQVELSVEGAGGTVTAPKDPEEIKLRNVELRASGAGGRGGVDDLIHLTHLHEPAILHVIAMRFRNNSIYTYTGPILLSVNPFQRLDTLYNQETLQSYYTTGLLLSQGIETQRLPPHVYAVADNAFRLMRATDGGGAPGNQSLLVSGESGAGKTVTTKYAMRYLATIARPRERTRGSSVADLGPHLGEEEEGAGGGASGASGMGPPSPGTAGAGGIERKILQSNPILEAFGNAKTLRNENSSRFGKFIKMAFSHRGELIGATIDSYLLEKVRVVQQGEGERNYHVFYQICRGLSEAERGDAAGAGPQGLALRSLDEHHLTNQSGCTELRDAKDEDEFAELRSALSTMGMGTPEQKAIWRVVAAVLHLGDVSFRMDTLPEGEGARFLKEDDDAPGALAASHAARLLGVDRSKLEDALTSKQITAGTEKYRKLFDDRESANAVEALAKDIYGRLFLWLVRKVNTIVRAEEGATASFIGILDIFGFEHFEHNSFEQLCINFTNETLQQHFNQFVFKLEQEEYTREGISWSMVDFPDNQECLDLIEGTRPPGLLALLDEQCLLGQRATDRGYASKLYETLKDHPRFHVTSRMRPRNEFCVRHYAGEVVYESDGFVDKNRDAIHDEATACVRSSGDPLIKAIYKPAKEKDEKEESGGSGGGAAGGGGGGRGRRGRRGGGLMSASLGSQFKKQLQSLMSVVRATTPHYVRCLKPNGAQRPALFEHNSVVSQLRCGGVLEAVRVARLGYPVRFPHLEFVRNYRCLVPRSEWGELDTGDDGAESSRRLFAKLDPPIEQVQIGRTKTFFRRGAFDEIERRRQVAFRGSAVRIQSVVRMRRTREEFHRARKLVIRSQAVVRGMIARRHVARIRANKAAIIMQAFARRINARIPYLRLRAATIRVQARLHGRIARRLYGEMRREFAATKLAAWRKGRVVRRDYLMRRASAVRIQCAFRRARARAMLDRLRKEAREVGSLRDTNVRLKARVRELEATVSEWKKAAKASGGPAQLPPDALARVAARADGSAVGSGDDDDVEGGDTTPTDATTAPSPASAAADLAAPIAPEAARAAQAEVAIWRRRAEAAEAKLRVMDGGEEISGSGEEVGGGGGASSGGDEGSGGGSGKHSSLRGIATAGVFARRLERTQAELTKARRDATGYEKRFMAAEAAAREAAHQRDEMALLVKDKERKLKEMARSLDSARREADTSFKREVETYRSKATEMEKRAVSAEAELKKAIARGDALQTVHDEQRKVLLQLQQDKQDLEDSVQALRQGRVMDSDVKMALAQRLDAALIERSEALEDLAESRRRIAALERKNEELRLDLEEIRKAFNEGALPPSALGADDKRTPSLPSAAKDPLSTPKRSSLDHRSPAGAATGSTSPASSPQLAFFQFLAGGGSAPSGSKR